MLCINYGLSSELFSFSYQREKYREAQNKQIPREKTFGSSAPPPPAEKDLEEYSMNT